MTTTTSRGARKEFIKLITGMTYRHALYDVFRDFCFMAAAAIANGVPGMFRQDREDAYMQTIGKYEREEQQKFPRLLALTVAALTDEPTDFLGEVFSELELSNAATGQFFTPYSISSLCAQLTLNTEELAAGQIVTVQEPAIGSGGMVVALAMAIKDAGFNPQRLLEVVGVDVDTRAVHMAYIQLSLLGLKAKVLHGNTLTMEFHDTWITPGWALFGAFPIMEALAADEVAEASDHFADAGKVIPEPVALEPIPERRVTVGGQLRLAV